jgi:hypothetical protein
VNGTDQIVAVLLRLRDGVDFGLDDEFVERSEHDVATFLLYASDEFSENLLHVALQVLLQNR